VCRYTESCNALPGVCKLKPARHFLNIHLSENMTLSHLQSKLLSGNAKRYSLRSSVRISFPTACRALRPASFSLEIRVVFLPKKASSSFKIACTDERVSLSFSH
jgi:hypothetical protein